MQIEFNKSLKSYNTFGIDAVADQFVSVTSISDLQKILTSHTDTSMFILGGGSNMLLTQKIEALVVHMALKGIEIVEEDEQSVVLKAMAGENWHQLVMYCISRDLGGVENLSLIPGNVGAAPIQNIGAYGVELMDVFESCEVLDLNSNEIKTFYKEDCQFGYRNSIFKNELKDRCIVLSVCLKLTKAGNHVLNTSYGAIQDTLDSEGIERPDIKAISEAVIAIRQSKLPDPKEIGNSGSFFKNPVIDVPHFEKIQKDFPKMPFYKVSESQIKVPAGWLVETCGFKGKRFGDAGVHKNQALVLVNYQNAKGSEIFELAKTIQKEV